VHGAHRRELVQHVLQNVALAIVGRTTFQRAIASYYDPPLAPGAVSSLSAVVAVATSGLAPEMERVVDAQLVSGPTVRGDRYDPAYRIGRSYYYPKGVPLGGVTELVRSRRGYLSATGWNQEDLLLTPFWDDGEIIGQVSVDDPADGRRPSTESLTFLEEMAAVAALSLRDASSLEKLTETHHLFQFLAESGVTGVVVVQDNRIVYTNEMAAEILGFGQVELEELTPWWGFFHPDDRPFAWHCAKDPHYAKRIVKAIRKDGREIWLSAYGHAMEYRGREAVACQFYDVTERVETEHQLKERALRDPLTGLRNRAYFDDTIHIELARSQRYKRPFTLMMADLRDFKRINDTLGHQEGDRILCALARIFREQLRDSDWIVRFGGDEFLFVLPETGDPLSSLVERIRACIAKWRAENVAAAVNVGVDFGWSMWSPDVPRTVSQLLEEADAHMYERKRGDASSLNASNL